MLDISLFKIEIDRRGFILDQSRLNVDALTSTEGAFEDVKGDFARASWLHSANIDNIMWTPEASELEIVTQTSDYLDGMTGRTIRVSYNSVVCFQGRVKRIDVRAAPVNFKDNLYEITLRAIGSIVDLNRYVLANFTRSQEDVGTRATAIATATGITMNISVTGRDMKATSGENPTALQALQDVAIASQGIFYAANNNTIVLEQDRDDEPAIVFSDDTNVSGLFYHDIVFSENQDYTVSKVVAETKDGSFISSRQLTDFVIPNQIGYTVDLPNNQTLLDNWVNDYPLKGDVERLPQSLQVQFTEYNSNDVSGLEVGRLASVKHQGVVYEVGIIGLSHNIEPVPGKVNQFRWTVDVTLVPPHIVRHNDVLSPSIPQQFKKGTVTSTSIGLTWQPPSSFNGFTGYEIRFAAGATAPTKTGGTLVDNLASTATSFTHTGRSAGTQYSYSIFATTADVDVYSVPARVTINTPTAAPAFTYNETGWKRQWLDWNTPSGNFKEYRLVKKSGGIPSSPTDGSVSVFPIANKYTVYGVSPSTNWGYALYTVTTDGNYSTPDTVSMTAAGTEDLPAAIANFVFVSKVTVNGQPNVRYRWDVPTSDRGDLYSYHLRGKYSASPPGVTEADTYIGVYNYPLNEAVLVFPPAAAGRVFTFAIWTRTVDGNNGAMDSVTITI